MSKVTKQQLDEWQALCEAATEGPWLYRSWIQDESLGEVYAPQGEMDIGVIDLPHVGRQDAAFIAAARDALPKLIAEVRRLEAILDHPETVDVLVAEAEYRRKRDEWDGADCEVCRRPVAFGSRHHQCGSAVLAIEQERDRLREERDHYREQMFKLQEDAVRLLGENEQQQYRGNSVEYWWAKAKSYGGIVHACSPALEQAGFPIENGPEGPAQTIAEAVAALASERDELKAEVERLLGDLRAQEEDENCRRSMEELAHDNPEGW